MTVYAVQAELYFRNTARRNTIASNIQTRLAQNVPWGQTNIINTTDELGADVGVYVEVRFNTLAEADSFWTDAIAEVGTGINGPVTGSKIYRHNCTHDSSSPSQCVVGQQQTW
jgi:hypothetical protein